MRDNVILSASEIAVVKGQKEILSVPFLSVFQGEFVAVTGPNGAGKSTLLKTLAFLESVAHGEITFMGQSVVGSKQLLAVRRQMAMVFQDPLLLSGTVMDNVLIGLKMRGISKNISVERARRWLVKLKIEHLADRDIRNLSGGEAQRVSLARAMVLEPKVLFLDEPFNSLDVPTKAALVSELKDILTETGTTALMVTHDLADMPFLADRIIVLMNGKVKQLGPVDTVLSKPIDKIVAEFIGVENILPGKLQEYHNGYSTFMIKSFQGVTPVKVKQRPEITEKIDPGATALICIRPEYVLVHTDNLPDANVENSLSGTIEAVYPYGYYYRLKISAGINLTALVSTVHFAQKPLQGDHINISLPPEKIHIIRE